MNDFSSKLDFPQKLETVESINAIHMQMAKYRSRDDEGYRAILSVLRGFISNELESKAKATIESRMSRQRTHFRHPALMVGSRSERFSSIPKKLNQPK